MLTSILLFSVAFIFVIFCCKWRSFNAQLKENVPPGPIGIPFLGHLPFLGRNPAMKFIQWKKSYGPIFSVQLGSVDAIVLNDVQLIKEAWNLQQLSGRPPLPNLIGMSQLKGLILTDGPAQREQRKFTISTFKELGVIKSKLEFSMQAEIGIFLHNLKIKCKSPRRQGKPLKIQIKHFFQFPVINSLWGVIMGTRFNEGDRVISRFTKLLETVTDTNTTLLGQLSWFFPWCAHILEFFGLNQVVNGYRSIQVYMDQQILEQRHTHVPGQPENFTHAYFDKMDQTEDFESSFHVSRQEQPIVTGDIFCAAIDTATTSLDWLLLYMARNPEIQRKLHSEIDSILSTCDPPSLSHRDSMPYTSAVLFELLRITTVVPLGMYRRALEDIDFHGFRIPKDMMVIANQFGVHHDPDIWEEPEEFQPERFIGDDGHLNKLVTNLVPFGYGKRICIGKGFALDQLFLFIASFFQKFSVECTDKIPSLQGDFGIVWLPKPFEVAISVRSQNS